MAGLQMALYAPKSEWVPPSEFPDLSKAKQIAIDLETRDPNLMKLGPGWPRSDGEVVGYAVAVDGWAAYFPINHLGGGNLDKRLVEGWMKKVCASPADKIFHNAQYDVGWLRAHGIPVSGRIVDTMVVASLLDENRDVEDARHVCRAVRADRRRAYFGAMEFFQGKGEPRRLARRC